MRRLLLLTLLMCLLPMMSATAESNPIFIIPDQQVEEGQPIIVLADPQGRDISSFLIRIYVSDPVHSRVKKGDIIGDWFIKSGSKLPSMIDGINRAGRGGMLKKGIALYLYIPKTKPEGVKLDITGRINSNFEEIPCLGGTITVTPRK